MKTRIMLGIMAGAIVALAGGELRAGSIAPDAKWAARLDIEKFKTTRTAEIIMERLGDQAQKRISAFAALFQFDPRKDLRDVTAYGFGKAEDDGVVVVRGRFNPEHLTILLQANQDYAGHAHGSRTIHSWIDDKERARAQREGREPKRAFGAFVDASTIVAGGALDSVAHALDVQSGARPGVPLVKWFSDIAEFAEPPVFVAGARLAEIEHLAPKAALFKQARSAVLHLDEDNGQIGVWAMLHPQNPEVVGALEQVASGLIALWKLKAEELGLEEPLARDAKVTVENGRLVFHTATSAQALFENIRKHIR
jgi:hypothetical protein